MTTSEKSPLLKLNRKSYLPNWIDGEDIKATIQLAFPVLAAFVLQTSIGLVAIAFVGRIGTAELAAASLGTMFANIMGFSVGIGFTSAMDTLCSQAYGAKNYFMIGIVCQRAILILGVLCIPLGAIWLFAQNILIGLGQDPHVSTLTGIFMRYQLIGLWPQFIYTSLDKYLQNQGITTPSMYVVLVVALLNPFIAYVFIYPLGWGFEGAAVSVSICRILQALFLASYIRYSGIYVNSWNGWTMDCFREWGVFISLGLPGCIMTCAEWWASEFLILAAGWIGTTEIGVQAVLGNTNGFFFSFPLSFAIACSIRVGNALGAMKPENAKKAWISAIQVITVIMVSLCLLMLFFRNEWPYLFSKEHHVVQLVAKLFPIVANYAIVDALQVIAAGALRGCGKQKIGAICNLIAYYVVGIPLALYCAFNLNMGIFGLWLGNSVANLIQAALLIAVVLRTDWDKEATKASMRVGGLSQQDDNILDHLPPSALTPTGASLHAEASQTPRTSPLLSLPHSLPQNE